MDQATREKMNRGGVADITTIGRKTGSPRRIEIYFYHFDGGYYLTGRPGRKRDWWANIIANPEFTLHLKRGIAVDVPVTGEPEPDPEERARVLRALLGSWDSPPERFDEALHDWVENAPFVRFKPL
jgi:deazaflavin-dependent oxidoreductase (nitroreductase family)